MEKITPLSETYKELGIAFTFPIKIEDEKGNRTYFENSDGSWYRNEYDENGKETYCEDSDGYKEGTKRGSSGEPWFLRSGW